MNDFNTLFQTYVNKDYDELLSRARDVLIALNREIKSIVGEDSENISAVETEYIKKLLL